MLQRVLGLVGKAAVYLFAALGLATAGTIYGLHASWRDSLPYHQRAEDGLETFWTTVRLREINLLSVRHSTLIPRDAPERSWEIWQSPFSLSWSTCERDGNGLGAVYRKFLDGLGAPRNCEDVYIGISVIKRDDMMTEAVLGKMKPDNLRAVALGLTETRA